MRYPYLKLSPQAAFLDSLIPEVDKVLGNDFTIAPVSELSMLGIDRIVFLHMIQFSAFYWFEPEIEKPGYVHIPLEDTNKQLLWPYQSLASWLIWISIPESLICILNMNDIKTRLTNWRMNAKDADAVLVSLDEMNLLALKVYSFKLSDANLKKYKSLSWNH